MKKIILGLSSVLMLCAVSCPSDSKPVSLKYADGEVKVGKVPAEYKTVLTSSGKQKGVYVPSTVAKLDTENMTKKETVLEFSQFAEDEQKQTVLIIGSKEELKFDDPANMAEVYKKLQVISNEVKNLCETDLSLSTSAASDSAIKIAVGTDKKAITLTTNAENVKVGDYVILVGGEKVTFTQGTDKKIWTGSAKADVTTGTTKAAIYKAKGANYLKNEITL